MHSLECRRQRDGLDCTFQCQHPWQAKIPSQACGRERDTACAGARVLRQDPVECLFQFVCSSNNHISRIHGMVERLCRAYGTPLPVSGKAADASLPEVQLKVAIKPLLQRVAASFKMGPCPAHCQCHISAVAEFPSSTVSQA